METRANFTRLLPILLAVASTELVTAEETPATAGRTNVVITSGPSFKPVTTPTKLLAKNDDGTVLVSAQPRFWFSELGCEMLLDSEEGRMFANVFELLTFEIEGKQNTTIWSSLTTRNKVTLYADKEYRFLIQPAMSENAHCMILRVWDGEKVVYEAPQTKEKQLNRARVAD